MNVDDFINKLEVLGEKWGTPRKSLFNKGVNDGTEHKYWDISFYKNGLKEEVLDLHSKSVPFYDIFLKPSLNGKTYLIYKKELEGPIRLIGLIQSSEIDYKKLRYPYIVASDTNNIIIAKGRVNISKIIPKVYMRGWIPKTDNDFLNEIFKSTIWKGSYALDISYLIGNSNSVFMNWDSNPLEGGK